jgi:hypothetical protein
MLVALAALFAAGCEKPAIELPAKGVFFADSLYSADLCRMTDASDGYSGNGIQNEYARADAWNCDGTYCVLRGNDGVYYLYREGGFALVRSLGDVGTEQEMEPRWHESDPSLFYYLAGTQLRTYDLGDSSTALVHDFADVITNCRLISTGVEGDASADRRYWALMLCDSAFGLLGVCTYDMEADSVLGLKTSFPDAVNHVTMDVSGSRVVVAYDSRPFQSFDLDFSGEVDMPAGAMGHADVALTADSTDVIVYQNVSTDYIEMADLETGVATQLLSIPFDVNPDIGMHISGNCDLAPGWVLVSSYGAQNPPAGSTHSWMDNLLFMLELKASPRLYKVCETHCYTGSAPRSNYFAEAFASVNRAGTRVVFGSNWGRLSPEDYTDAYKARLPAGWNQ